MWAHIQNHPKTSCAKGEMKQKPQQFTSLRGMSYSFSKWEMPHLTEPLSKLTNPHPWHLLPIQCFMALLPMSKAVLSLSYSYHYLLQSLAS